MPRRLLKPLIRNRPFVENATMALVLPFAAGLVNAEGFFMVGVYTSHVTGTVARAGHDVASGQLDLALRGLGLVAAFFLGAFAATALVDVARRRQRARYAFALGAEVMTLLAVTFCGLLAPPGHPTLHTAMTLLLCFAMGCQNAMVSRLSGAVVRNTHLTGIVTDLGIEAVRGLHWLRKASHHPDLPELVSALTRLRRAPELKRMRVHAAIFVSFLCGAILGPLLYLREGYIAMLLPIAVLTALLLFDAVIGLHGYEAPEPR